MNATVATTLIGALGASFFGGLYALIFYFMRTTAARFDRIDDKFDRIDGKFERLERKVDNNTAAIKDLEIRLSDKFTSQLKALDDKFTELINGQSKRIDGIYDVLCEHGERLVRIEL